MPGKLPDSNDLRRPREKSKGADEKVLGRHNRYQLISERKRIQAESEKQAEIRKKWWEKPATKPGEACNAAQARLGDFQTFTGVYRRRADVGTPGTLNGPDYCSDPLKAEPLLLSRSASNLTIPRRAKDFCAETEWRLNLRPLSPPRGLPCTKSLRRTWQEYAATAEGPPA
eukprot:TRINITY_DN55023_c0_g1_i1.p1 TRINITY_DN55023_c0_g1~~TRINITY_DN55023_c0_g1_i1.p1  ORF type:complete len:171 (-),score=28.78 TRINITY_DN55023_c0_g1_i1:208-720(-)